MSAEKNYEYLKGFENWILVKVDKGYTSQGIKLTLQNTQTQQIETVVIDVSTHCPGFLFNADNPLITDGSRYRFFLAI